MFKLLKDENKFKKTKESNKMDNLEQYLHYYYSELDEKTNNSLNSGCKPNGVYYQIVQLTILELQLCDLTGKVATGQQILFSF